MECSGCLRWQRSQANSAHLRLSQCSGTTPDTGRATRPTLAVLCGTELPRTELAVQTARLLRWEKPGRLREALGASTHLSSVKGPRTLTRKIRLVFPRQMEGR